MSSRAAGIVSGVSDAAKREHERLAQGGDLAARVRLLRERVRDGTLLPSRLELAAYAGDEAAFEALEPEQRRELLQHEWNAFDADEPRDPRTRRGRRAELLDGRWLAGLGRWGAMPPLHAVRALWRLGASPAPSALALLEAYMEEPSDAGADALAGLLVQVDEDLNFLWVSAGPAGLPRACRMAEDVATAFEKVELARSWHALRDGVVSFALSSGPIFRFDGFHVLEELEPSVGLDALRARDPRTGEEVRLLALARPLPEGAARKITDALRAVDHPNVARLVGASFHGDDEHARGIVLAHERAFGSDLDAWAVGRTGGEKRAVLGGIFDAVAHAHDRGLLHGHLQPASIKVAGETPRLCDLGLAQLNELDFDREVGDGVTVNAFYAPELLRDGPKAVTRETDVYGLGALAFWLLEGRPPYGGDGVELAERIVTGAPPRASWKDAALRRALAKDPKDRFPTLSSFRAALGDE